MNQIARKEHKYHFLLLSYNYVRLQKI